MFYFASLLQTNPIYQPAADRLLAALYSAGVEYRLLDGTHDIWLRDFMPVQIRDGSFVSFRYEPSGYTSALKAPVRCFGNHLSGKRKSWFRTDNECGGAAILKTRTSRMGTPVGC